MYVLVEGEVVVMKSWKDQEYDLRHLGYGDSFGEMALIDLFPRSASVCAVKDSRSIELTNAQLFDIYQKDLEQFTLIQMNMSREINAESSPINYAVMVPHAKKCCPM